MSASAPELDDPSIANPWHRLRSAFCVFNTLTQPSIDLSQASKNAILFRQENGLPGVWPERLLHVESMTSYKRENLAGGVFYNGVKEPLFSIVSYKWGLHVLPEGPTLEVAGIDWDPPAIDQKYFTTLEQLAMLQKIGRHSWWVWVDVGCITQLLMDDTLREIIIEPQYFKQASQRFVWWLDFPTEILQRNLINIYKANKSFTQAIASPGDDIDLHTLPQIAAEVLDTLIDLISIPWFASNWTLREIVLCDNIVILGREGDPISVGDTHEKETVATIGMVAELCVGILAWLQRIYARVMTKELEKPIPEIDRYSENYAGDWSEELRVPYSRVMTTGPYLSSPEIFNTVVLPTLEGVGPTTTALAAPGGTLTLGPLATHYIKLVEAHGPFFLYASSPEELNRWTRAVLETGVLVHEGLAGPEIHAPDDYTVVTDDDLLTGPIICKGKMEYHGWGGWLRIDCECSQLCGCRGDWNHDIFGCKRLRSDKSSPYPTSVQNPQETSLLGPWNEKYNNPTQVCIPCLLGISFQVTPDYAATAHVPIGIPQTESTARTGVKTTKLSGTVTNRELARPKPRSSE